MGGWEGVFVDEWVYVRVGGCKCEWVGLCVSGWVYV